MLGYFSDLAKTVLTPAAPSNLANLFVGNVPPSQVRIWQPQPDNPKPLAA